MSTVVDLRVYTDSNAVPTLVLVDLQQEYIASPRMLALPDVETPLRNCLAARTHARKMGFPVAFVRWVGRSPFFNSATPYSRWIDGFVPIGTDMVFERDRPSCYASTNFAEVMTTGGGNFVLAGFAGQVACLSTAIEAFHRGHRMTYLADASASHALNELSAPNVHRAVTRIIGLYADVMTTQEWIAATSSRRRRGGSYGHRHE